MFANLNLVLRSYTSLYGIFMSASLTLYIYSTIAVCRCQLVLYADCRQFKYQMLHWCTLGVNLACLCISICLLTLLVLTLCILETHKWILWQTV